MAYSSVRVQFEIGHEASVRTKKTPEGFTHDWEVFVRGADSTDIQYFVDKVVFYLHETFPKPRRVIKEPPYVVKESGYAGFVLPIDVYLKNKEEPKKISFQYDLTLQPSGPPISRVLREPRLFQNPSEDFRRKLIRGGGVGVDTPSEIQSDDVKSTFSISTNKIKLIESPVKKHKLEIPPNDSFSQLFGTPIRRIQDSKKLPELAKKLPDTDVSKDRKKTSKHGPYNDKDAIREKDKYLEKDKNKDRDKNKEKSKRPPSPPLHQVLKTKEEHRRHEDKEKKKEDHDDKRQKKEEKDKREKNKDVKEIDKMLQKDPKKERRDLRDGDYLKKVNINKSHEGKLGLDKHRSESVEKERPEKEKHKHRHKKKEKEKNRDKEKHRKDREKIEKSSKERDKEKERSNKKRYEEGKERDDKFKRKSKSLSPGQERLKKGPLNALLDELGSSDSASPLSEEDSIPSLKSLSKPSSKIVPEIKNQNMVNMSPKLKSTNSVVPLEISVDKENEKNSKNDEINLLKSKKEKSLNRKVRKFEKGLEKKRAEEVRARSISSERDREDEEFDKEKISKEETERCEKERREEEKVKVNKDKEGRKRKREKSEEKHVRTKKTGNIENNLTLSQRTTTADLSDTPEESRKLDKFTKEYVAQLKDLQHKIMTLEDNTELQKVVKVIAETGQYEITKKTFDFDLCALDFETVKRLQEFFAPT